jgi:hypothetical protein
MGLRVLRNLDLIVLAAALAVFVAAELPLLGYGAAAAAWLGARAIEVLTQRRAIASGDRRTALGMIAGGLVGRLYLIGLTVLATGLVEREAGVAAGLLAVTLFTVHFSTMLVVRPLEEARR